MLDRGRQYRHYPYIWFARLSSNTAHGDARFVGGPPFRSWRTGALGSHRYPACRSNLLVNLVRLPTGLSVAGPLDHDDKAYGESIGTMSIGTMFPTRRLS